jgi:FdhD protein
MISSVLEYPGDRWMSGETLRDIESIAEEVPVALVYNGISHAVMMATPQDLHDFALGFSLTEGILQSPRELLHMTERAGCAGIELSLTITNERFADLRARRRNLVGRTGCGLCGVDSLEQAVRSLRGVQTDVVISPAAIARALQELPACQVINSQVHAVHAAAWALREGAIAEIREDVGRHNALDKLVGAMAQASAAPDNGFAVITSRCSYEMVQKAAASGIGVLVAVSAPTALALRVAEASGLTLVARARAERYTLYTHPHRIASDHR